MNERLEEDNMMDGLKEWLRKDAREEQQRNAATDQMERSRASMNSMKLATEGREEESRKRKT
jgi:hypothetical protein